MSFEAVNRCAFVKAINLKKNKLKWKATFPLILQQNLHQPSNLNKQIMPKELLSATHSHEALIMMLSQFPDTLKLLILQLKCIKCIVSIYIYIYIYIYVFLSDFEVVIYLIAGWFGSWLLILIRILNKSLQDKLGKILFKPRPLKRWMDTVAFYIINLDYLQQSSNVAS